MGAYEFQTMQRGRTAQEAFDTATEQARYEHGHGGYTGTIAEKHGFREVPRPHGVAAKTIVKAIQAADEHFHMTLENQYARASIDAGYVKAVKRTQREMAQRGRKIERLEKRFAKFDLARMGSFYGDKWDDAGAMQLSSTTWIFWGMASS